MSVYRTARLPAGLRLDLERREAAVKSCVDAGGPFSVERSFGDLWCGSCGYAVSRHGSNPQAKKEEHATRVDRRSRSATTSSR